MGEDVLHFVLIGVLHWLEGTERVLYLEAKHSDDTFLCPSTNYVFDRALFDIYCHPLRCPSETRDWIWMRRDNGRAYGWTKCDRSSGVYQIDIDGRRKGI